jgi:uncharacterized membrane protein
LEADTRGRGAQKVTTAATAPGTTFPATAEVTAGRRGERASRAAVVGLRRLTGYLAPSLAGITIAVAFLCLSLTPSLLPRTWLTQGVISGLSSATGYLLGVAGGWAIARVIRRQPSARARRIAWRAVTAVSVPLVAVSLFQSSLWQRDIYRLMDQRPPARPTYSGVLVLAVLICASLVALARALRLAARTLAELLARWIPATAARLLGTGLVVLLVAGLLNNVVFDGAMRMAVSTSESVNDAIVPGLDPPTSPTRSGSPTSLVSWSSLGSQGRAFVAGGPSTAQLQRFSGGPPVPPVRVYAGLGSASTVAAEAALAVRELWRTGGFSRKVLCVIVTTGTGWVDPSAAAALEYLYNGDTALVAMQYSYLPSWISFAVEQNRVAQAGRELFNEVYAVWSTLPPLTRPKLLVFGESLGSLGAEAAFADLGDLRRRVDGALWVGPTSANSLWNRFEERRDRGSSQVLPSYQHGDTVRFAGSVADLEQPSGLWGTPRVVYLQHSSDPITWWSPQLLVRRPDWLRERRGADTLPAMRWYPFVTFWQVTADLLGAREAPPGHGHRYDSETAAAWAAIAAPSGWTAQDTARLVARIDRRG